MRQALSLLIGSGLADLAFRVAQVALPLVVLAETGSVAATGLAGGAAGIPILLSPWWARRARQWIDSGPRLAAIAVLGSFALAMVPTAAGLGVLHPAVLVASGLLLGTGEALSNPGRSALLADAGDRWAPDRAVLLLTWQDGLRRVGMVVGPPIGAFAVAAGLTRQLLWIEAGAVLLAGVLALSVRGERRTGEETPAPSIRQALAGRRDVLHGWITRGTGCFTWFAFTLGLSVIGAEQGRPGVYLAAGMSGYGVGSVLGTSIALAVIRRVPPVPTATLAWTAQGLCWVGMGTWTSPVPIGIFAAIGGVSVALGISAISALITRTSAGADRRALLGGQSVVVNANSAAGLLVGGPVIALVGAKYTLIGAGLLTAAVAIGVLGWRRVSREPVCRASSGAQVRCSSSRSTGRGAPGEPGATGSGSTADDTAIVTR